MAAEEHKLRALPSPVQATHDELLDFVEDWCRKRRADPEHKLDAVLIVTATAGGSVGRVWKGPGMSLLGGMAVVQSDIIKSFVDT